MTRILICAAALAALFSLTAPAPAEARIANPGLSTVAPTSVQDVQWRRRWHRRHWHCWRDWRGFRHCAWRYW